MASRFRPALWVAGLALASACGDKSPTDPIPTPEPLTPRLGQAKVHSSVSGSATGLSTRDLTEGVTPEQLANALVGIGGGITISNVTYTGAPIAAGEFEGGTGIIGFETGIILSTGRVSNVIGPNSVEDVTQINNTPGDAQLSALINEETLDAAVLEFDFVPNSSSVRFEYVFASDEYNEFVNSQYNDVFAFLINGQNCAVLPGGTIVSVNNVNAGFPIGTGASNSQYYINNDPFHGGLSSNQLRNTEMDGLTVVLTCEATVTPNVVNRMKLAIADVADAAYDSNVFIRAQSLVSNRAPTATISAPATGSSFAVGTSVAFAGSATDPEEGALGGSALVWTSNLDGQIGTGTGFSTSMLSVGTHTITLTATDSQGATGTAQITITITPQEEPPPPPLTVQIDIEQPGAPNDTINLAIKNSGMSQLAIVTLFGSAAFNTASVDIASLRLGDGTDPDAGPNRWDNGSFMVERIDVNGDGRTDLRVAFCLCQVDNLPAAGPARVELVLRGQTTTGTAFRGSMWMDVVGVAP